MSRKHRADGMAAQVVKSTEVKANRENMIVGENGGSLIADFTNGSSPPPKGPGESKRRVPKPRERHGCRMATSQKLVGSKGQPHP